MDDRSRKLLSPQALPKAAVPDPQAHVKREFKLPAGVGTGRASSPSLDELRAKALGIGTSPTTRPASAPAAPKAAPTALPAPTARAVAQPIPVGAQGSAPTPAPPVLPPPLAAKLPVVRRAAAGTTPPRLPGMPAPLPPLPRSAPPASTSVRPPAQVVMPVPQGALPESLQWPAVGTPMPGPLPRAPEAAAPVRRASSPRYVSLEKTPPPLPPPPIHVVPTRATPPALVTIGSEGVSFREATSMWFRTGDEEAARAVREAERDLADHSSNVIVSFKPRLSRWQAVAAGAGGMLAVYFILTLL